MLLDCNCSRRGRLRQPALQLVLPRLASGVRSADVLNSEFSISATTLLEEAEYQRGVDEMAQAARDNHVSRARPSTDRRCAPTYAPSSTNPIVPSTNRASLPWYCDSRPRASGAHTTEMTTLNSNAASATTCSRQARGAAATIVVPRKIQTAHCHPRSVEQRRTRARLASIPTARPSPARECVISLQAGKDHGAQAVRRERWIQSASGAVRVYADEIAARGANAAAATMTLRASQAQKLRAIRAYARDCGSTRISRPRRQSHRSPVGGKRAATPRTRSSTKRGCRTLLVTYFSSRLRIPSLADASSSRCAGARR